MTKDLAVLVGADQKWLSTSGFLDKIDRQPEDRDEITRSINRIGNGAASAAPFFLTPRFVGCVPRSQSRRVHAAWTSLRHRVNRRPWELPFPQSPQ